MDDRDGASTCLEASGSIVGVSGPITDEPIKLWMITF